MMALRRFRVEEFDWEGATKKVEIRSEKVIRDLFQLAKVLDGNFVDALNFVLTSSTERCIDEVIRLKSNLRTPLGVAQEHYQPSLRPEAPLPPEPVASTSTPPTPQKQNSDPSGADLI